MADRLKVVNLPNGFYALQWVCDGEDGMTIGMLSDRELGVTPPESRDEWENWIAHKVAMRSKGAIRDRSSISSLLTVIVWETHAHAAAVLKQIKVAWQARDIPEWAQKALDAGWKPPKGWKP